MPHAVEENEQEAKIVTKTGGLASDREDPLSSNIEAET